MPKQLPIEEEVWDKKRVIIAVVVFILLVAGFIFAKNYFFPQKNKPTVKLANVKGIQTQKLHSFSLPTVDDVSQKIQELQDKVTHVDVGEIASSSPQIQQIMKEIQNLPNLPKNVAKQACINLCSKL